MWTIDKVKRIVQLKKEEMGCMKKRSFNEEDRAIEERGDVVHIDAEESLSE